MQLLLFILIYPLLWVVSILPNTLFYAFSDFICFLVYHVVGYRKDVVRSNLSLVFPSKSTDELKRIEKEFYKHMCDMFLEMVKTLTISNADVKIKYHPTNIELLQEIEKEKSILLVCSHYANWEWNVSLSLYMQSKCYAVYQKITNPYFDRLVKRNRSKWNTFLISQQETVKTVISNHRKGIGSIYGMVSDQSPQAHRAQYWKEFMGVKVPIFTGAESLARKLDLAVVFLKVSKVKRGKYAATFIPITLAGSETEEHEITDRFLALTEAQINDCPEHYLWTHRRWKHRNRTPK